MTTKLQSLGLALGLFVMTQAVFAHGTVIDPISRVYRVYQANPSNPSFPLAASAVAIDGPNSYYTWNEVSRNISTAVQAGLPPGFDYSPWVPDGQLASGGRVDPNSSTYPRTYAGLDQVSADWPTTPVQAGDTIPIDFYATAVHNPSVWDVWMTTPDWDPSSPLNWAQMEFLGRPQPTLNAGHFLFDVQIPANRSGHHVLWIAWHRNDPAGEVFFSTSDLLVTPLDSVSFCDPADNNSTGVPTILSGSMGSGIGSGLHLEASQGPDTQFGFILVGTGVSDPGMLVSQGHLCLSGTAGNSLGRYNVAGGALNSTGQFDSSGVLQNLVGTSTVGSGFDVPTPVPSIGGSIGAGSTWHFQLWHREANGESNFSNGLSVTF